MTRVVGIGNLVCDLYYKDGEIIGINGGKTFANIIFNLSNMNIKNKIIGSCGNDIYGYIALDSLKRVNVDISDVQILNNKTNLFHINIKDNGISNRRICPLCHSRMYYNYSIKNININEYDIIVIDSLKYLSIINKNIVMLDIGYYNELNKMNDQELEYFLNFKFEIINMNDRVFKYLKKRLNIENEIELYKKFNTNLLIVTKGNKGASYYYKNNFYHLKLNDKSKELDPTGAGDMFFASTINDYIKNNFNCDENFVNRSFKNATNLTKEVVKVIGSRSYYQKLYRVEKIRNECACHNLSITFN